MKIIVSAGGTGGHIYPALALVDYIKKCDPDTEFLFVGTTDCTSDGFSISWFTCKRSCR